MKTTTQTTDTNSARLPEGTIRRQLMGIACACCGHDIKAHEPRVTTAQGVHCSAKCAAEVAA